jgi:PST family polysaccharide transporter
LQSDPDEYRHYYRRFIECIAMAGFPLIGFAIVKAEALVLVMLGEQWKAAVPLFLALAPAAIIGVLNVAGGVVFLSMGRTDRQLRATIVTAVIVAAGIVAGLPYGAIGVAIGFSATFTATLPAIIWYAFRDSPLRGHDIFASVWRPIVTSTAAASLALCVGHADAIVSTGAFIDLGLSFATFGATYFLVLLALPGGKDFMLRLGRVILARQKGTLYRPESLGL